MQTADHVTVVSQPGAALHISGAGRGTTALCRGVIGEQGASLEGADLTRILGQGNGLRALGAPFAAMLAGEDEAVIAADHVGYRHVYAAQRRDWAGAGTSARVLAKSCGAGLDLAALSVFRLAGHYLDSETAYAGVRKLPAEHYLTVGNGQLRLSRYPQNESFSGTDPAPEHAARLRGLVEGFVRHHDEVTLELSGGLDSRLVLAAVPAQLRQKLTAFTIQSGASPDALVAMELAHRFGMRFETVDIGQLGGLDPAQAFVLAMSAARRQDGLGRPLSAAALAWAESQVRQGPRLSGHGGELARAMFEFERPHATVRLGIVDSYIRRWIVSNDAVSNDVLEPSFARESNALAFARLREVLQCKGSDWYSALGRFYLRQRMQRWAGITITDGCLSRVTLNPLSDAKVLRFAEAVPPHLRAGSRYVVRVLDQLDPQLARIPLGSGLRPLTLDRPVTLTRRLGENSWRGFLAKASSKVIRTVCAQRRAAAGAPQLAGLVVAHWRANPGELDSVAKTGLINQEWLEKLVDGLVLADTPTVDFLINLRVITT